MPFTLLFATFLIGFATAKLKPVLRHKKDAIALNEYQIIKPDTVAECEQTFNALDQDNSGAISLGDVEVASQHLSNEKTAELTDALSQMLYATGITSIQDDFSLSRADYMYFCMNADDMEAAIIAKRVEMKRRAEKEKQHQHHKQMRAELEQHIANFANNNHNHHHDLQDSCFDNCHQGRYCASGQCRRNGSCSTVDDCFNPFNHYDWELCLGTMECNSGGECNMNCGTEPATPPTCIEDCGPGKYCGSSGCIAIANCATVEDCFLPDNAFPLPYVLCEGRVYCTQAQCNFQCNDE